MGFVIYNPLAGGLLTGKHSRDHIAEGSRFSSKMYQDRYWNDKNFDAIDIQKKVAEEAGMSPVELATRWCLSNDFVDSIMMGFSKLSQLEQNLAAVDKGPLSPELRVIYFYIPANLRVIALRRLAVPEKIFGLTLSSFFPPLRCVRAKSTQLRFRHQALPSAENCVHYLALPSKPEPADAGLQVC